MENYCGKCGKQLDKNGQCPNNCICRIVESTDPPTDRIAKNKKKKRVLFIVAIFSLLTLSIVVIAVLTSNMETINEESSQQDVSKMMNDGRLNSKEFKSLIDQGAVDKSIGGEKLVTTLCDIVEKCGEPAEENIISKEDAKEVINDIIGQKIDYDDWTSSSWTLYLYEYNDKYVFMEYNYYEYEKVEVRHFRIFDAINNNLYIVIDGMKGFRYIEYKNGIDHLHGEQDDNQEYFPAYNSAFVDKETRKIVCGFEWNLIADNCYIHAIYGNGGNAEIYALASCRSDVNNAYFDSSFKEITEDKYDLAMDNYSDFIKRTYDFDFGHWGI